MGGPAKVFAVIYLISMVEHRLLNFLRTLPQYLIEAIF